MQDLQQRYADEQFFGKDAALAQELNRMEQRHRSRSMSQSVGAGSRRAATPTTPLYAPAAAFPTAAGAGAGPAAHVPIPSSTPVTSGFTGGTAQTPGGVLNPYGYPVDAHNSPSSGAGLGNYSQANALLQQQSVGVPSPLAQSQFGAPSQFGLQDATGTPLQGRSGLALFAPAPQPSAALRDQSPQAQDPFAAPAASGAATVGALFDAPSAAAVGPDPNALLYPGRSAAGGNGVPTVGPLGTQLGASSFMPADTAGAGAATADKPAVSNGAWNTAVSAWAASQPKDAGLRPTPDPSHSNLSPFAPTSLSIANPSSAMNGGAITGAADRGFGPDRRDRDLTSTATERPPLSPVEELDPRGGSRRPSYATPLQSAARADFSRAGTPLLTGDSSLRPSQSRGDLPPEIPRPAALQRLMGRGAGGAHHGRATPSHDSSHDGSRVHQTRGDERGQKVPPKDHRGRDRDAAARYADPTDQQRAGSRGASADPSRGRRHTPRRGDRSLTPAQRRNARRKHRQSTADADGGSSPSDDRGLSDKELTRRERERRDRARGDELPYHMTPGGPAVAQQRLSESGLVMTPRGGRAAFLGAAGGSGLFNDADAYRYYDEVTPPRGNNGPSSVVGAPGSAVDVPSVEEYLPDGATSAARSKVRVAAPTQKSGGRGFSEIPAAPPPLAGGPGVPPGRSYARGPSASDTSTHEGREEHDHASVTAAGGPGRSRSGVSAASVASAASEKAGPAGIPVVGTVPRDGWVERRLADVDDQIARAHARRRIQAARLRKTGELPPGTAVEMEVQADLGDPDDTPATPSASNFGSSAAVNSKIPMSVSSLLSGPATAALAGKRTPTRTTTTATGTGTSPVRSAAGAPDSPKNRVFAGATMNTATGPMGTASSVVSAGGSLLIPPVTPYRTAGGEEMVAVGTHVLAGAPPSPNAGLRNTQRNSGHHTPSSASGVALNAPQMVPWGTATNTQSQDVGLGGAAGSSGFAAPNSGAINRESAAASRHLSAAATSRSDSPAHGLGPDHRSAHHGGHRGAGTPRNTAGGQHTNRSASNVSSVADGQKKSGQGASRRGSHMDKWHRPSVLDSMTSPDRRKEEADMAAALPPHDSVPMDSVQPPAGLQPASFTAPGALSGVRQQSAGRDAAEDTEGAAIKDKKEFFLDRLDQMQLRNEELLLSLRKDAHDDPTASNRGLNPTDPRNLQQPTSALMSEVERQALQHVASAHHRDMKMAQPEGGYGSVLDRPAAGGGHGGQDGSIMVSQRPSTMGGFAPAGHSLRPSFDASAGPSPSYQQQRPSASASAADEFAPAETSALAAAYPGLAPASTADESTRWLGAKLRNDVSSVGEANTSGLAAPHVSSAGPGLRQWASSELQRAPPGPAASVINPVLSSAASRGVGGAGAVGGDGEGYSGGVGGKSDMYNAKKKWGSVSFAPPTPKTGAVANGRSGSPGLAGIANANVPRPEGVPDYGFLQTGTDLETLSAGAKDLLANPIDSLPPRVDVKY